MQTNHLLGNRCRSFYGTNLQCDSMPLHLHTITFLTHLIIQTFALSMVFSSFPTTLPHPHYHHLSSLVFLCLQQNFLYLLDIKCCHPVRQMQLGRQKWLNDLAYEVTHKTCLYSDSVSRKGKEQPPVPVVPMAPQGSTSTGTAGGDRGGRPGLPAMLA